MKKENQTKKKLSLNKLQLAKITDLNKIIGGGGTKQPIEDCVDADNGSKPVKADLKTI